VAHHRRLVPVIGHLAGLGDIAVRDEALAQPAGGGPDVKAGDSEACHLLTIKCQ
jgi:hypothetical protein